jgi:broad specificity phosphatase PhoE
MVRPMRPAGYLLALALGLAAGPAAADHQLIDLRDRGVGLMRHGGAVVASPGTLPPLRGCDPSAVLTAIGREEMRRWGDMLRDHGLGSAKLLASRQCSAMETATLLSLGPVEHEAALDPLNGDAEARTEALRRAILAALQERRRGGGPVVFITHRANIAALTGLDPAHGEVLVLDQGLGAALTLLGRLVMD